MLAQYRHHQVLARHGLLDTGGTCNFLSVELVAYRFGLDFYPLSFVHGSHRPKLAAPGSLAREETVSEPKRVQARDGDFRQYGSPKVGVEKMRAFWVCPLRFSGKWIVGASFVNGFTDSLLCVQGSKSVKRYPSSRITSLSCSSLSSLDDRVDAVLRRSATLQTEASVESRKKPHLLAGLAKLRASGELSTKCESQPVTVSPWVSTQKEIDEDEDIL